MKNQIELLEFGNCDILNVKKCHFCWQHTLTTERVQIQVDKDAKKGPGIGETLKQLVSCGPLLVVIAVALLLLIGSLLTSTMNTYLYKDYFNNTSVMALASLTSTLAMLLMAPFATKLAG